MQVYAFYNLRRCVHEPPPHRAGRRGGAVRLQGVLALSCVQALAGGRACLADPRLVGEGEAADGDEAGSGIQGAEGYARSRATAAS